VVVAEGVAGQGADQADPVAHRHAGRWSTDDSVGENRLQQRLLFATGEELLPEASVHKLFCGRQ